MALSMVKRSVEVRHSDQQIDEEMILSDEVSDEAMEAAASATVGGFPTLPNTYCFCLPVDPGFLPSSIGLTIAAYV